MKLAFNIAMLILVAALIGRFAAVIVNIKRARRYERIDRRLHEAEYNFRAARFESLRRQIGGRI